MKMKKKRHNPEKRSWRGKSYKKGGKRVRELRNKAHLITELKAS